MKTLKLLAAAAALAVAGTAADAVSFKITGGFDVFAETGNYKTCSGGSPPTCYNPDGLAPAISDPLLQTLTGFSGGDPYPGLEFDPAGGARLTVTYLGKEARSEGTADTFDTFSMLGGTLSTATATPGDSYSVIINDLDGEVPFKFTSPTRGTEAGFEGISTGAGIAFSEIFNDGKSVYAFFDNGGANNNDDWDDMVVRLDIAPVPLPAAGFMLLAGLGGLYGMRRMRKSA